ncbi:MAG: hypothetical protein EA411_05495 [Saprospirales bacterium]|nr:MAG: hypothetical protein EA411_05495 [Saprospirales bacterium]
MTSTDPIKENEEGGKSPSDLSRRMKTAFFIGLVVLSSLYVHPIAFLVVFGLIFYILGLEFYNLRNKFLLRDRKNKYLHHGLAVLSIIPYLISLWFYMAGALPGPLPGTILLFALLTSVISITDMYGYTYSRLYKLPSWVLAIFFLGTHFSLLPLIFFVLPDHHWFLAVLFTIWASDSAAYMFGKRFGRRKLYPKLSPRKTLEGLVGGFAGGMVMMGLFCSWLNLDAYLAMGAGLLIAIGVSMGDLVESRMKRLAGVKDSGVLLPGHGGIYDRFDGLFFILPYVFIALVYWRQFY